MLKQGRNRHPLQYQIQRHRHHQRAAPQLVSPHLVAPALSYIGKVALVSTTLEECCDARSSGIEQHAKKTAGKKNKKIKDVH